MSQSNGHPLDTLELACLPASDPRRRQHAASLTGDARAEFERQMALTDQLHAALPAVAIPPGLASRLLAIAHTPTSDDSAPADATAVTRAVNATLPPKLPSGFLYRPATARLAAGLIILAGIVALYFLVLREPSKPVPLDAALANNVAALAVQNDQAAVEIASTDPAAVKQKLDAHALGFPVLMLEPTSGTLQGGGVCDFGGTKAAFTRWNVNGQIYTLYQFDGRKLSIPPLFYALTRLPENPAQPGAHNQVFVFPGTQGKCCWALVMENESSPNVFSKYGDAY